MMPENTAEAGAEWQARIRRDHPRLFFNAETWPGVKARALGANRDHFEKVKAHADGPPPPSLVEGLDPLPGSGVEVCDWGQQLMSSSFVYLVEPDPERLDDIKAKLRASTEYYHACYAQGEEVNWYAASRVACFVVLDWLWDAFAPEEREQVGRRLMDHAEEALYKPDILRRNNGDHTSGFYGAPNIAWFAGLALYREGIDDERALHFLTRGYDDHMKLLAHRAETCGDDGGEASPTLGYSFGEYPLAEWNFLHTYRSATGEDIAQDWTFISMMPNYVLWNWLPGGLEFGYGDTPHATNKLTQAWMYTHMSHIVHFFRQTRPEWAALGRYIRDHLTDSRYRSDKWSIYPFLMTDLEKAPPAQDPGVLPPSRYFKQMGQVFMRSGSGSEETYALVACGGTLRSHRHYDATHFTIYKKGFLALDSGTRQGNTDNLQNYFAQTVAHNCILIKMPGEPPSPYWNGEVFGQAGGQNRTIGSKVIAFETESHFTYVAGDATPVYSEEKCERIVRQFVFIPPNHFAVFDRVSATRAEYAKRWLLHHANEPVVEGKTWFSDQDRGRVFVRTLLPEDAILEKVGGPDKEFLADGVNYAVDAGPSQLIRERKYRIYRMEYDEVPELMGRWRIEVKPGSAREEDIFLHLIQVGDQALEAMGEVQAQTTGDRAEVRFNAEGRDVVLSFATTGEIGGHIRICENGQALVDRELTGEVMPQSGLASLQ